MKNIYEKLEEMLERFRKDEDNYSRYRFGGADGEIEFDEELDKVMKEIGITQWDFTGCGGFNSPGYDIDCYCLAYVDLEGRLQTIPVAFEIV